MGLVYVHFCIFSSEKENYTTDLLTTDDSRRTIHRRAAAHAADSQRALFKRTDLFAFAASTKINTASSYTLPTVYEEAKNRTPPLKHDC